MQRKCGKTVAAAAEEDEEGERQEEEKEEQGEKKEEEENGLRKDIRYQKRLQVMKHNAIRCDL